MSDQTNQMDVLQQLIQLLGGSLSMYLEDADPWTGEGSEKAEEVLSLIVYDQRRTLNRAAALVTKLDGVPESPSFPARYTALNDVSLGYLIDRLSQEQAAMLARLQVMAASLPADSEASELVQEAAGAARAHQESLEELTAQVV